MSTPKHRSLSRTRTIVAAVTTYYSGKVLCIFSFVLDARLRIGLNSPMEVTALSSDF